MYYNDFLTRTVLVIQGTKYSKVDEVKFVEDSL